MAATLLPYPTITYKVIDITDTEVHFLVNGTGQQQLTGHNGTPKPVAGLWLCSEA